MPLRVHCPNGCLIRLPAHRAGSSTRCGQCKAIIALPTISETELLSGKPIPVHARLVHDPPIDGGDAAKESDGSHLTDPAPSNGDPPPQSPPVAAMTTRDRHPADLMADGGQATNLGHAEHVGDAQETPKARRLAHGMNGDSLDASLLESSLLELQAIADSPTRKATELPQIKASGPPAASEPQPPNPTAAENGESASETRHPVPRIHNESLAIDEIAVKWSPTNSGRVPETRVLIKDPRPVTTDAEADHHTLTRFYGSLLGLLGLLTAIPAAYLLVQFDDATGETSPPRWIYFLLFCGGLQLLYALFLIQVTDWSALWAVSLVSLVAACGFGALDVALLLDDGFGPAAQLLQVSFSQRTRGMLVCLVGLCTSVLVSYLCGREAWMWQRWARMRTGLVKH